MGITSINPATGEPIATYRELTDAEVFGAVEAAHAAWNDWRTRSFAARGDLLRATARVLRERASDLARLMALEMGKPVVQGRAEVEKCAWGCEHFAEHAEPYLARDVVPTGARRSYVDFEPLGVVLAVMPWNFPLWQVFRFAAPALMAGNTALLKHASNVPGCAIEIEGIVEVAGLPAGVFRNLTIGSEGVRRVIEHRLVRAVTLTGSTPAGAAVAAAAGGVVKKTVLELGGSDAYIVLEDADLERAAEACVAARIVNAGQSCIAAKRFIVVEPRADAFAERFAALVKVKRIGDPLDEATEIGPLARRDLRDGLHRQVADSVARGARAILGGEVPAGPGAYYPPTVLTDVGPGMPAYDEELFGPVAAILRARDEDDAIRMANDTPFGLGAAVFTRDAERGERVAREIDAGSVYVNAQVASDPRLPFGGIKASGYGRELGAYGIKEFTNAKTILVA